MSQDDSQLKQEVSLEIAKESEFVKELSIDDWKSGDWFLNVLTRVISTYQRNARAEYFTKQYPGLPSDVIAEKLIGVCLAHASVAGGIAGVAVSTTQITTLASFGASIPLLVGAIGGEIAYISKIQLWLVLDLMNIYGIPFSAEDPEDIMNVFQYALGIKSGEVVGSILTKQVGVHGTTTLIKTTITKGTLVAFQKAGKAIGVKILQRTLIKFAVPFVSVGLGAGFNYVTTRSIAKTAQARFSKQSKQHQKLDSIMLKETEYGIPHAAALWMIANSDSNFSSEEQSMYESFLKRVTLPEYKPAEFDNLARDEGALFDAIRPLKGTPKANELLELVVLMAICDGNLDNTERVFITKLSELLEIQIDEAELHQQIERFANGGEVKPSALKATFGRIFKR